MTGQTTAGAHPASTLAAADPITSAAASTRAPAGLRRRRAAVRGHGPRPGADPARFNLTRNALSLLDDGSLGWIQAVCCTR